MATSPAPLDTPKPNAFIGRFVADIWAAVHFGVVVIGEKLGLFLVAAALLLAIPGVTTLAQAPHRKEAIILEGRPKDKNNPEDPSFDQDNMTANAAQMQTALEAHGYTVHVTNSWTGDKDSFTGIINNLSTGSGKLASSDEVVIYITGHGKRSELQGTVTLNDVDKSDLTGPAGQAVNPNDPHAPKYYGVMEIGGTGSGRNGSPTVTSTMLKRELKMLPDKHTGVVIDTCYAGMNVVPLSQVPGVESVYTSSAAWECAYFGAVGTTIQITLSNGTTVPLAPRTDGPTEGSAFSNPFIRGLTSAPPNASVADLLKAGNDFALAHDPTAVAGRTDTATQTPLSPHPSDKDKESHKYKTHPQEYDRPDPRIAATDAENAYNTADTNFKIAGDKVQATAKAVNDAAQALDAAKAANPQGGQAVNDAQRALDKAIANDAAAAGAERAAKDTLDAKKKDLDKAQEDLKEFGYNAPAEEDTTAVASTTPTDSEPVSQTVASSEASGFANSAPSAPPDLPDYEQPPAPAPGYLWAPGYWNYAPGNFFWVPGTWVLAPAPGLLWTPGYWGFAGGLFLWNAGYWGPHVGFYGGVNYGFGYGGVGFVGGVWDHGVFHYNAAVTNVDTTKIHDTYTDKTPTTTETTARRTSFNGGSGTTARPTSAEEIAASEPHTAPTSEQTNHEHLASTNPSLFASQNGGHPAVAATTKAGEFNGKGVVAAHGSGVGAGKTETQSLTMPKSETHTEATTPTSKENTEAAKGKKKAKPPKSTKSHGESKPAEEKHPK